MLYEQVLFFSFTLMIFYGLLSFSLHSSWPLLFAIITLQNMRRIRAGITVLNSDFTIRDVSFTFTVCLRYVKLPKARSKQKILSTPGVDNFDVLNTLARCLTYDQAPKP